MGFSKNLETTILNYPKNSGYLIAYSGGADSTALLHLLSNSLSNSAKVRAIHINHGIQENAKDWQNHCQLTCDKLGIDLIIEQANLTDASEESSRKARYHFFRNHLQRDEILLTAHHNQDQSETVLLKLLRGTGIKGLTGINGHRSFANGFIARPLLGYSPQELKNYLNENNIRWIEDASNANNNYKRNYIRNKIIPNLQTKFPQVVENISRSATNTSQSLALLNHLIGFEQKHLEIDTLKTLPTNLQTTLIYHWLSYKNLPVPDKVALEQITKDFAKAKSDKQPHYQNGYYQLFRWQNAIYCLNNFELIDRDIQFIWNTKEIFTLPNDCGQLKHNGEEQLELVVKFNQQGLKLKTHKHKITKTVKQLFQENQIPIWQRYITPFIYHNEKLVSLRYNWSKTSSIYSLELKLNTLVI